MEEREGENVFSLIGLEQISEGVYNKLQLHSTHWNFFCGF